MAQTVSLIVFPTKCTNWEPNSQTNSTTHGTMAAGGMARVRKPPPCVHGRSPLSRVRLQSANIHGPGNTGLFSLVLTTNPPWRGFKMKKLIYAATLLLAFGAA